MDSGGGSDPLGTRAGGSGVNRCRKAFVKKRQVACSYALGEDIRWTQIVQMDSMTVVGKIIGKNVSIQAIEQWINSSSVEHLGVLPELEGLTRGWFALNFTQ